MCGIVGVFNRDGRDVNPTRLEIMANLIEHRGPDDEGYYVDGNVGLWHKRLSIIDLSTGKQPIYDEDRRRLIIYNGEVYNYRVIRQELEQKGRTFRTQSDTEVVLLAYDEWGPEAVKRFNGMFAFAIWDRQDRTLFIARDRLGIKPMYYWQNGEHTFVFASEIKAILAHPDFTRTLNIECFTDYLTFQNIIDEKTMFSGVKKLMPGHWLRVDRDCLSIEQYWKPDFTKKEMTIEETLEGYNRILNESVQRHMISDVPVGFYLSGGIDSGSVSTVGAQLTDHQVSTFTGSFPEGEKYTELPCSRAVAEAINAQKHEVELRAPDFISSMPEIVYHLDEPRSGSVAFPAFHVSRLASNQVKVVLTGHGGDELFAGYQVFKAVHYRKLLKRNPLNLFKILGGMRRGELARILYFLVYPLFQPEVKYGLFIMFSKKELKKLLTPGMYQQMAGYNPMTTLESMIDGDASEIETTEQLYLKTYLPDLFMIEDRVGMANAIEARTPLCDNELVEFALSVPIEHKLHDHTLKFIPRETMKNRLPRLLYEQPKKGFPTPLVPWFRGPLRQHVYETLTGELAQNRGIFAIARVRKILDTFCGRKTDTLYDYAMATKIYALYTIELWFRIFMDPETVEKPGKNFFKDVGQS